MGTGNDRPAFLIYMYGHLRSFSLLSNKLKEIWDAFSEGKPYVVFLHTWDEIDHSAKAWHKIPGVKLNITVDIHAMLADAGEDSILSKVVAHKVDPHPGLQAYNQKYGIGDLDSVCRAQSSCVEDAAQQLDELAIVHHLAKEYLESSGIIERYSEEELAALPIIRTRPDITIRCKMTDSNELSYSHIGPPSDGISGIIRGIHDHGSMVHMG
ncbi:hypothetical protein CYMTET_19798 [Cymbomonas tetramitiformis]|uniref:Uncharacterized protein n=1 Tax=Cymbomonas tetramitiformis TaxID=36881 RepID=A0AAE0L4L2_9CHLO|nr:hypothetical protein CYMTET_19798 [Cymbomonas tetramitiformis]